MPSSIHTYTHRHTRTHTRTHGQYIVSHCPLITWYTVYSTACTHAKWAWYMAIHSLLLPPRVHMHTCIYYRVCVHIVITTATHTHSDREFHVVRRKGELLARNPHGC